MRYLAGLLAGWTFAALTYGQPPNAQVRPWNLLEAIAASKLVAVGDLAGGSLSDDGKAVHVNARLRLERVLAGEGEPGKEIAVSWRFLPPPDNADIETTVPRTRVLMLLRPKGEAWEALRVEAIPTRLGGFLSVVPDKPLPAELQYPANAPLRTRIAHELGWELASLEIEHAAGGLPFAKSPGFLMAQEEILSLHQTLASLDPTSTRAVYKYFSASPEPQLELLGIAGRAMKNDITAIFDLEKDYDRLATADEGNLLPRALMYLNFTTNIEASHALGRVALSQNAIASVDSVFAFRVWMTGKREFLPYLMAMLGSPDPTARGAALFGVCQLAHRTPENQAYCFDTFRPSETEGAKEKAAVQYWREWWEQNRAEIAKTVKLPEVVTPARYGGQPAEDKSLPLIRFQD